MCARAKHNSALLLVTFFHLPSPSQDVLGQPMLPVNRTASDVQVWHKALTDGRMALVFFHRNATGCMPCERGMGGCCRMLPPPNIGSLLGRAVTVGPCGSSDALALDMPTGGATGNIVLRSNRSLCLGSINPSWACDKAATGVVGVVACNAKDTTQLWHAVDPATNEILSAATAAHDLNAARACAPSTEASVLIYPVQGHDNEKWSYAAASGNVNVFGNSGMCLAVAAPTPPPSPPPPQPQPRNISVSWEQLGWSAARAVSVRDLWAKQTLGTFTSSFSASVAFHEARIYVLTPQHSHFHSPQ